MPARAKRVLKKKYFTVTAPESLGGIELLPVMAVDTSSLIRRTYECLLYDITEDIQHQTVKLYLRIVKVDDEKALTVYGGHEYLREYLRSLIIRGTSCVEAISDVKTKDGVRYRIRVGVFTVRRINTSKQKAIRKIVVNFLGERLAEIDNDTFIKNVLFGKLSSDLYLQAKKICPIRHVGIVKVKLLSDPIEVAAKVYGGK